MLSTCTCIVICVLLLILKYIILEPIKDYVKYKNKRGKQMRKNKLVNKIIKYLDMLSEEYPNTKIIIDAPNNTNTCLIGNALVYKDINGDIVIDGE